MALSLVQKENWTNPTEVHPAGGVEEIKKEEKEKEKETKTKANHDLVCVRHKGTKLSLLLHIIDGFVIEESNVPFKGSEEEVEVTEGAKPDTTVNDESNVQAVEEDEEVEIANASMNSYPQDKDELMSLLPTTCKYCGGELPEDRAMWGKRFCSVSCGKKYSVKCSQRMRRALQRRTSQSSQNKIEYDIDVDPTIAPLTPVKRRRVSRNRLTSTSEAPVEKPEHSAEPSTTPKKPKAAPPLNIDLNFTFPPRDPIGYGIDALDVENDLYDGAESLLKYSLIPMIKWNTTEVFEYISRICGSTDYAKQFCDEEIDGQALLLLKIEHMVHTMNIKLGPALKIASHLRLVKLQYGVETFTKYLNPPLLP